MKKVLLLLLAVSVLTLSCTNKELYDFGLDQPARVTYMPVNKKTTRAIINSGAFPTAETFHSVAWTSTQDWSDTVVLVENKFIDDEIYYDNEQHLWISEKEYYWPLDYKVNFFAYYPDSMENGEFYIDKGVLCLKDYVVSPAADVDLLIADALLDAGISGTDGVVDKDYADGVPTIFRHKMTKIQFRARLADNYRSIAEFDKIVINSISLYSINNKGDWSFNSIANNTHGVWTNQSGATFGTEPDLVVSNVSSAEGVGTEIISSIDVPVGDEIVVLPQYLDDNAKIIVDYTVYYSHNYSYSDKSVIEIVDQIGLLNTQTGKKEYVWDINKYYTYTLKFDLTSDVITWSPSVEDWDLEEINGPVVNNWDNCPSDINY